MTVRSITVGGANGNKPSLAAMLVQVANKFESKIYIEEEDLKINVKSIMGMLTLEMPAGKTLRMTADGEDEVTALDAIADYLGSAS